jgi:hypothetical protein
VAVHPEIRRALLISYGTGTTAKALTDTAEIESIDVVDISREILELSAIVHPDPASHPLRDPRVRAHVEDGRFFLLTTRQRYDLITAEPPPPRNAGVVSLYSQEYFQLLHDRLAPGGIASYWLPVFDLSGPASYAIIRAFCAAFPDCSLWNGDVLNWMLVGTRDARGPVSEERFERQWADPVVGPQLRDLGLETPELLGATFMADAPVLLELALDLPPVVDDRPQRLVTTAPGHLDPSYFPLLDTGEARLRFERSSWVRSLWPARIRQRTLEAFETQRLVNDALFQLFGFTFPGDEARTWYAMLDRALTGGSSRSAALLVLRADPRELRAAERASARNVDDPLVDYLLGARALAERDYLTAESRFGSAMRSPALAGLIAHRALALCLAGRPAEAAALARQPERAAADPAFWEWLDRSCGRNQSKN